jgi:cytochrome c556
MNLNSNTFRRALCVGLAIAIGTAALAAAQQNAAVERRNLMKQNNDHLKTLKAMAIGKQSFDTEKIKAAFSQWDDTARALPSLFPPDSKTGADNRASPKIWDNTADFETKIATFAKAIKDAKDHTGDVDQLKKSLSGVTQACDDCHEIYRLPR